MDSTLLILLWLIDGSMDVNELATNLEAFGEESPWSIPTELNDLQSDIKDLTTGDLITNDGGTLSITNKGKEVLASSKVLSFLSKQLPKIDI